MESSFLSIFLSISFISESVIDSLRVVGVQEQYEFLPLGVNLHFYANYVNKFCFVLHTNMAAMQTTYYFLCRDLFSCS